MSQVSTLLKMKLPTELSKNKVLKLSQNQSMRLEYCINWSSKLKVTKSIYDAKSVYSHFFSQYLLSNSITCYYSTIKIKISMEFANHRLQKFNKFWVSMFNKCQNVNYKPPFQLGAQRLETGLRRPITMHLSVQFAIEYKV